MAYIFDEKEIEDGSQKIDNKLNIKKDMKLFFGTEENNIHII